MTNPSDKKESDELSPEESALAKKIFVAFGFLGIAVVIIALVSYLPIEYVVIAVLGSGLAAVTLAEWRNSTRSRGVPPK